MCEREEGVEGTLWVSCTESEAEGESTECEATESTVEAISATE